MIIYVCFSQLLHCNVFIPQSRILRPHSHLCILGMHAETHVPGNWWKTRKNNQSMALVVPWKFISAPNIGSSHVTKCVKKKKWQNAHCKPTCILSCDKRTKKKLGKKRDTHTGVNGARRRRRFCDYVSFCVYVNQHFLSASKQALICIMRSTNFQIYKIY